MITPSVFLMKPWLVYLSTETLNAYRKRNHTITLLYLYQKQVNSHSASGLKWVYRWTATAKNIYISKSCSITFSSEIVRFLKNVTKYHSFAKKFYFSDVTVISRISSFDLEKVKIFPPLVLIKKKYDVIFFAWSNTSPYCVIILLYRAVASVLWFPVLFTRAISAWVPLQRCSQPHIT